MTRFKRLIRRRSRGLDPNGLAIVGRDGAVLHGAPENVADGARYLLARVQLNDPAGLPSRIAVTASLSGEGTSYVARTLSSAIAHDLQKSTCLVDLNWWSDVGPDDEFEVSVGIGDVIGSDAKLDDVLVPTQSDLLWLAPAGRVAASSRPVLARNPELQRVLDELSARFEYLVLDLPPVLVTSETLTLMRFSDAYILVVQQGVTSQRQVRQVLGELRGAVSLGVVLNRVESNIPRRLQHLIAR